MKESQQSQIFQIINDLTKDDDYRQELWCQYLSGAPITILNDTLTDIKKNSECYARLQEAIWITYKNPPSPELLDFLSNFTEFERSIMFLLMVGLSADEVSKYKDISTIRVMQVVSTIKNNPVWKDKWPLKDASQTKKNTD